MQGQHKSIDQLVETYRNVPGALLPVLHDVQAIYGHIPPEFIPPIARGLNLSAAEVHGVISFYTDFKTEPAGRHRIQICRSEACQALGSRELEEHAIRVLGVEMGATTPAGITLEPVYCLGNCACSPSVRVDDDIYARVDAARFDQLCAALSVSESESS